MIKNDKKLILIIFLVALVLFITFLIINRGEAYYVIATVNGEHYGEWPLDSEHSINVNGTNLLLIKDGKASVIIADCLNQICVNHEDISQIGETIICLPNRVVISITGD